MPEKRNCAAPQGWIAATTRNTHWKPGDYDEMTAPGRLNATTLAGTAALQGAFDALTLTIVQLVWRVTGFWKSFASGEEAKKFMKSKARYWRTLNPDAAYRVLMTFMLYGLD